MYFRFFSRAIVALGFIFPLFTFLFTFLVFLLNLLVLFTAVVFGLFFLNVFVFFSIFVLCIVLFFSSGLPIFSFEFLFSVLWLSVKVFSSGFLVSFKFLFDFSLFSRLFADSLATTDSSNHRCNSGIQLQVKDIWYVIFQHSDVLHTLPEFSYIFLLQSPQTVEWRLQGHHFSDASCSWTSITDELFLEQNASAIICSWIARHVTALICDPLLHLWLLSANNKRCWKSKTFDMPSFSIQTL